VFHSKTEIEKGGYHDKRNIGLDIRNSSNTGIAAWVYRCSRIRKPAVRIGQFDNGLINRVPGLSQGNSKRIYECPKAKQSEYKSYMHRKETINNENQCDQFGQI
jgi:hypothetical protein